MIIRDWTWGQWKAAGRHGLTAVAAVLTTLGTVGLLKTADVTVLTTNISTIADSVGKIATSIGAIIAVLAPVYAALRAANSAKPENQAAATVRALDQGLPLNGKRAELIRAIADQPEVKKVELEDKALADRIPTPKVQ